jgi:predicted RNase H-like nuclease (RuvC/YqgF family)
MFTYSRFCSEAATLVAPMLPAQVEDAANGGSSDRLDVPADARVERLQRRIAALERQLEARIAQIADLQEHLAEQQRRIRLAEGDGPVPVAEVELRHKAAEYDALMATLTMRILRRPRAWYTEARRRLIR